MSSQIDVAANAHDVALFYPKVMLRVRHSAVLLLFITLSELRTNIRSVTKKIPIFLKPIIK